MNKLMTVSSGFWVLEGFSFTKTVLMQKALLDAFDSLGSWKRKTRRPFACLPSGQTVRIESGIRERVGFSN